MQGLTKAQRNYDAYLPADTRTDAEIERDAAEHVQEGLFVASPEAVARYEAHKAKVIKRQRLAKECGKFIKV